MPVNLILTGSALVVGTSLCVYVGVKAYAIRRENLEEEAEMARESSMPDTYLNTEIFGERR